MRENFRRSFYHSHLRSVSLILGSGDPSYTAIASFCLPGNGGFDTTVSPAFVSGKAVALVAPFLRRLLLRFNPESSSRSTLLVFLCPIDSRSENLLILDRSKMIDVLLIVDRVFSRSIVSSVLGSTVELNRALF